MSLGKMKILILCVVLSTFITNTNEDQDFFTVFRIGRPYTGVQTELHRLTNVIGLPLRTRNGFFIDSVADMPSLKCSPAIEGCGWTKSGNWIYSPVNVSQDEDLSVNIDYDFNLHGYYETCDDYNGGCEFWCSHDPGGQICICPTGGSPQPEDKSCDLNMKINTSGYFETDGTSYSEWYIIPPVNSTTEINILSSRYISTNVNEVSRERDRNSQSHGSSKHVIIENDNFVTLGYTNNRYYDRYDYDYHYQNLKCIGKIEIKRNHLTLDGEQGTLTYEVFTLVESLCLSVIYKQTSHEGALNLQISSLNGTDILTNKVDEQARGDWKQKLFYASVGYPNTPVRLSLEVNGRGTTIYSINGCSPYGKQDMTVTKTLTELPKKVNTSLPLGKIENSLCMNGGFINNGTMDCTCPVGFRGSRCEEGCGPNSYGKDCSATCSPYNWGCSRMIFCKPGFPCMCAPGYKGPDCDTECYRGTFGVSCSQRCGNCVGMHCDVYTGICFSGCEPGFYPPYCVTPYKYIETSPIIVQEDFNSVKICFNLSSTNGEGEMKYYQIEYYDREAENKQWIETWSLEIDDRNWSGQELVCDNITDLLPGHHYTARVILIAMDGNRYRDKFVPRTDFVTLCSVPQRSEYGIRHALTYSGFTLQWQYETNQMECQITNFTVILRKRGHTFQTLCKETQFHFNNLIPNTDYEVIIQANTERGSVPFSPRHTIKTGIKAPRYVSMLKAIANGKKNLYVSWLAPGGTEASVDKYIIKYKCVQYLACPQSLSEMADSSRNKCSAVDEESNGSGEKCNGTSEESNENGMDCDNIIKRCTTIDEECNSNWEKCNGCHETELIIDANQTSTSLNNLRSHAVYEINVAGVSGDFTGPFSTTSGLTDDAEPDVAPTLSDNPTVSSTNTSAIVQWKPSPQCNLFNGYFAGYHYELLSTNETLLQEGVTRRPNATFYDLLPQQTYTVNVYLISSGGINRKTKISFNVSTKATVPSEVRDLTVYKRGRRIIGLRWKEPRNIYGEISSFSVSHCQINDDCVNEVITRIPPSSCSAWPDYYCHTINKQLLPNKHYSVTIKARNADIDEDGNAATIKTITSEGEPQQPLELQIINTTYHSATILWKPPFIFNGILRSFLVNIEHTDSENTSTCCGYFPLQEMPVTEEQETYSYELNGLLPASKYVIGISAKTLSLGSSSTLTINTPPVEAEVSSEVIEDFTSKFVSEDVSEST